MTPPPPPHDQFVQNFFNIALVRSPAGDETTYWYDQLRVAYANGSTSLKLASIEFGRTLFESAEYAARNRNAHWYVYDLYKTYLMRDPDPGGWAMWEGLVPTHGREYVRRGFEESGEFATLTANITTSGSPSSNAASLISARVDPRNQPGRGMLSRDATWTVPLLSLPGRAGLDLGLTLSYSSMVWTRSGPYIYFDEDNGFPSPGFRLGFPTVQRKVFDVQTAKNAYLLISGNGQRVELRQVGTSNIYDAADSSYLRLTEDGAVLRVHSTDGTRLSFTEANGEYRCTELKDRNGNYMTVSYNALGQINTITDTLGRVITFNYDNNDNPVSITQLWGGQPHTWATFGWLTHTMQSSFGSLRVIGTANNAALPVLKQVGLPDGNRYEFEYTNAAQVSVIRRYRADNSQPFYNVFQYESTSTDTPRLSQTRVAAENWTSLNGVPGEVTTYFAVDPDGACRMSAPDGTIYKEYYGTGWQKGLTTVSEVWSGGVKKKWSTTVWTQDNTAVSYEVNPRVTETNVYDSSGNRRRTTIDYGSYAQWGLPYLVKDYAANGTTEIRHTFFDYNLSQAYLDRRIIGLVSAIHQTNISSWQRKIGFTYDDPTRLHAVPAAATQHDTSYNMSFTARGNVTAVSRWDVDDIVNPAKALTTYTNYFTTGTPKSTTDPSGHQNNITYGDSFSDNVDRNTFAYPTTFTDADNFTSTVKYNFNFGGKTRTERPPPAEQPQGAIQTITYDTIGRVDRITTVNNNAYIRYVYGANFVRSFSTVNNTVDEEDNMQVFDGVGRVIATFANHPGSTGLFRAQMTIYDLMGRAVKTSNPTEITGAWVATGDDSAGWLYTEQTYDWQGRPLRTTHPDTTYREASYSGCGCAGGEVVTLTDEGTIDAGVAKRRQQKIYSDVLGRTVKTEILNWQGGSVYSATVNTYNARDQVTQVRQYAGPEGSGSFQDTTMTYDGYGRLKTRHVPEQSAGTTTTWAYNADDTIHTITDARGATATLTYNNARHLPNIVTHTLSGSSTIVRSFAYDAAGNRTSMTDEIGLTTYHYDQLSRMDWEERTFSGVPGVHRLTYGYNLANQLQSMTDPAGSVFSYSHDTAGRVTKVANALSGETVTFAKDLKYRAWGVLKELTHGGNNFKTTLTYNQRLQLQQYRVVKSPQHGSTVVIHNDYGYYDDGQLKSAVDGIDNKFDRSYRYDQVGRLSQAFTGALAISQFADSGNGPYYQTYQHDVWGNLTARNGRYWSEGESFSATYTNNRRQGSSWVYDAEGNAIQDPDAVYSYDAGGQNRAMTSANGQRTTTQWHDGDGQAVRVERRKTVPSLSVTNAYYLRSSVLGGRVVTEFNSAGQKTIGRVYLGDIVLGLQDGINEGIVARHENPITGSYGVSYNHGTFHSKTQEDPMGINVGLTDPFEEQVEFEPDLMLAKVIVNRSGECICPRCFADGIELDCRIAGMMVAGGSAARCPNDDCGPRVVYNPNTNRNEFSPLTPDPETGQLGSWRWRRVRNKPTGRDTDDILYLGTWFYRREFATGTHFQFNGLGALGLSASGLNPQTPITEIAEYPLVNLKKLLRDTLDYSDCAGFMERLLQKAAQLSEEPNEPIATDMMKIYSMLNRQARGGIESNHVGPYYNYWFKYQQLSPVAGGGGLADGYWQQHNRKVFIDQIDLPARTTALEIARVPYRYALRILHEFFHVAGSNSTYDHDIMNASARALGSRDANAAIREHCIPTKFW